MRKRVFNWTDCFHLWSILCALLYRYLKKQYYQTIVWNNQKLFPHTDIHPSVHLGECELSGNIVIGEGTYMNAGQLHTGYHSRIQIGRYCAIGYNVKIIAITHDLQQPAGPNRQVVEKDIAIGDHVWIGSNVFIREGVTVGNHVVIGANAVVTKDIPDNAVVGGVPARIIKMQPGKGVGEA